MLTMEIPSINHNFIIGSGGRKVNQIMDETKTSIHFPDYSSNDPKVSICGSQDCVEDAQARLRYESLFELAFVLPRVTSVDDEIITNFKHSEVEIQTMNKKGPNLMVLIKGIQKNVIVAVKQLLKRLSLQSYKVCTRWITSDILDIDFAGILQRTGATSEITEVVKYNVKNKEVKFKGSVYAVCQAFQELVVS